MPDVTLEDGRSLHYETWGDAGGPAVVLLHGFTADHRMWSQQVEPLAAEYRVIAPDLRGHGRSDASAGTATCTLEGFAEDIRDLMDALGVEVCALAGCSFGGMIALQFAVAWPERLACLVVSDASPAYDRPDYDERFRDREAGIRGQVDVAAKFGTATLGKRLAADIADPFLADGVRQRFAALSTEGFLGAAHARRHREDITERLSELHMPVLLADGDADPAYCALDIMARRVPAARVVTVRGAGHGLPVQRPEQYTRMLMEFLHDVEDGAAIAGRGTI